MVQPAVEPEVGARLGAGLDVVAVDAQRRRSEKALAQAQATLAVIQARFGDHDAAVAALPHLLEVPAGITVANLKFDPIWDRTVASVGKRDQYAAYSELDYLLFDWLNLRGTFEFVKVSQAQDQTRYTIGAEPFINHVLQPRIQYRINNSVANQPDQNHDELWLELHVFL